MSKVKKTLIQNGFLGLSEIKLLRRKFAQEGVIAALACYFAMSGSQEGWLSKEKVLCEAEDQGVKKTDEWLSYCTSENIITEKDGKYTNSHVEKDRKNYGKVLEYDRKRKGNKKESSRTLDIDIDIDNVIDPDLILSGDFNTPLIQKALTACRSKLRESKRDLNQQTLDALCMRKGSPELLLAALSHTATLTKAANVYDPPTSVITSTNGTFKRQTNFERTKEILLKDAEDEQRRN